MKAIVLMGISCLMLAAVYGVMIKKSEVSSLLSFNKAHNTVSSFGSDNPDKAVPADDSAENKTSTSNTLDDSHWIDDPLFEKAVGSELITDNEVDVVPQQKGNPESIKREAPESATQSQSTPEVKQLILELGQDSTPVKNDLVEVI